MGRISWHEEIGVHLWENILDWDSCVLRLLQVDILGKAIPLAQMGKKIVRS